MRFYSNTFVIILAVLLLSLVKSHVSKAAATPDPVSLVSWTWIGGQNGTNNPGKYGTLNVTSAGSVPGGRYTSAGWVGSSGLVYLFGGFGYGSSTDPLPGPLNDFWYFNPSSLEWAWIGGNSTINEAGVYGTFRKGSPTNIPGGRSESAYWQTDEQHFWLFGGFGFDKYGKFGFLNDVWMYDTTSGNWTWVAGNDTVDALPFYGPRGNHGPGYNPGARNGVAFWTGSDGLLWLFGGRISVFSGEFLSDLWSFNTSSFEWAYQGGSTALNQPGNYSAPGAVNASNAPGGRVGSSSWTDTAGNFWLFGGSGYGNSTGKPGYLNDLWVYNRSLSAWIFMAGNDTINNPGAYGAFGEFSRYNYPGGRDYAASVVDALGNLQLFAGLGISNSNGTFGLLNDLWVFDIELRQWAWINGSTRVNATADYGTFNVSSPNAVPGARLGPVLWNTNGNDPIVFGGSGYSNSSALGTGYLNDVFFLAERLSTPTPTPEPEPVVTGGSAVCFPADASVLVDDQDRVVPMSQIRPGMKVMGADRHGRLVPDTVLSWLHYEPSAVGEVLVIATASGKRLRLTRHHLVYRLDQRLQQQQQQEEEEKQHQQNVHHKNQAWQEHKSEIDLGSAFEAVYAERVRVGDALYDAVSRSLDRVVSVESARILHGLYAPLTRTGRLVVDGLLVSCYGTYPSHAVSHAVLWPARVATLRGRWASWLGVQHTQGIMPYAAHLYGLWTSIDRITEGLKAGMIAAAC